jgi:hypothetical protein
MHPGTAEDIWYRVQHSTGVEAVPLEMRMVCCNAKKSASFYDEEVSIDE